MMLGAISLGFIVNMAFVIVSRTAMVTIPVMLAVFALLHLKWRTSLMIFGGLVVLAAIGLRGVAARCSGGTDAFVSDYHALQEGKPADVGGAAAGILAEIAAASLPRRRSSATGRARRSGCSSGPQPARSDRATAKVIGNPHNQTLAVAVQWGVAGIILLYAMWLAHLRLFRGEGLVAWIGLLVVVQNIFTSLFNSHIFDFHEGWMYVLGVGVAGGMMLAARSATRARNGRGRVMGVDHERREINSIGSMLSVMASARHDPFARMLNVDLIAVLVAVLLPWSTSGVGIGMLVWLAALAATLELRPFLRSLQRPICALPIALVALAALGTLWSDASWGARLLCA